MIRGTLWVTWVEDSHVVVARSEDRGTTFSPGVRVTQAAEPIDANGDARPKVAIGQDGEVFVAWTRTGTRPYTGDIRFARSMDGGRTFSAPRVINDDGLAIGHRFETLAVNALGDVFLVWIDKRDLDAAQAAKEEYAVRRSTTAGVPTPVIPSPPTPRSRTTSASAVALRSSSKRVAGRCSCARCPRRQHFAIIGFSGS